MNVREIMSQPAITVPKDTPLAEVARVMVERGIGRVPAVTDGGRLAGIVTESDFSAKERGVPFSLLRLPQLFGHWLDRDNVGACLSRGAVHYRGLGHDGTSCHSARG